MRFIRRPSRIFLGHRTVKLVLGSILYCLALDRSGKPCGIFSSKIMYYQTYLKWTKFLIRNPATFVMKYWAKRLTRSQFIMQFARFGLESLEILANSDGFIVVWLLHARRSSMIQNKPADRISTHHAPIERWSFWFFIGDFSAVSALFLKYIKVEI